MDILPTVAPLSLVFAYCLWRAFQRHAEYGRRRDAEKLIARMTRDEVVGVLQRARTRPADD